MRPMPNRKRARAFSLSVCEHRNSVERFSSKIEHLRAVAARLDEDPGNFLASIKRAAVRLWLPVSWVRDLR